MITICMHEPKTAPQTWCFCTLLTANFHIKCITVLLLLNLSYIDYLSIVFSVSCLHVYLIMSSTLLRPLPYCVLYLIASSSLLRPLPYCVLFLIASSSSTLLCPLPYCVLYLIASSTLLRPLPYCVLFLIASSSSTLLCPLPYCILCLIVSGFPLLGQVESGG